MDLVKNDHITDLHNLQDDKTSAAYYNSCGSWQSVVIGSNFLIIHQHKSLFAESRFAKS